MTKVPHPYIIEAKGNQPLYIRIRDVIFTAIMWLAYFWLLEDFFGFASVMYDWKVTGVTTSGLDKAFELINTMEFYLQIIFINSLLLISWALYNQVRFRGKDRRKPPRVIGVEDLATLYGLTKEDVTAWQGARILTIHHDTIGTIEKVATQLHKTESPTMWILPRLR